jgi:hypothetical protein
LQLKLFPNPVVNELKIKVVSQRNLNIRIQLFNIGGSLITEEQFMIAEGEQVLDVKAEALPKGLYIYVCGKEIQSSKKEKL